MKSKSFSFAIGIFLFFFVFSSVFGDDFQVTVTGYTSKRGAYTSTGTTPKFGTLAVSRDLLKGSLPYGICVQIPDIYPGHVFRVEDTMAKKWTNKLDIWVGSREEAVRKIGKREDVSFAIVACPSGSEETDGSSAGSQDGVYDLEHDAWIPFPLPVFCPIDFNGDDVIDIVDIVRVARRFGEMGTFPRWVSEDINGDGAVDIVDVVMVARHFGKTAREACGGNASLPSPAPQTFASFIKSIFWVLGNNTK